MSPTPAVLRVDPSGHAPFRTINEAVAHAEGLEGAVHFVLAPGVYREKVFLDRPDWSLFGAGATPEATVIFWDDHARRPLGGRPMRTFNSATLFVGGDRFLAENLTIANDAGPGSVVGQAVAAYVDADAAVFRRCRFLGRQDTLFTGPLPPDPKEASDFGGPRDTGPGRLSPKAAGSPAVGRQLYEDCYLEGDIDFLFGSAEAVFRRCQIHSLDLGQPINGWISAASTPVCLAPRPHDALLTPEESALLGRLEAVLGSSLGCHGHLFVDCRLTAEPGVTAGSVYLGRPWRNHARSIYLGCHLGAHIHPAGWDDWGKADARTSCTSIEAGCHGPGARSERVPWATVLP